MKTDLAMGSSVKFQIDNRLRLLLTLFDDKCSAGLVRLYGKRKMITREEYTKIKGPFYSEIKRKRLDKGFTLCIG